MHRRLGWMLLAALATAAHADPGSGPVTRSTADPLPPDAASEPRPELVAAAATAPAAPAALDARNLRMLTDDPVVGKASRVDGDERQGVVAFTFDDGPNPETTPAVIDALEKYGIPATFFIVTQRISGKHGEKGRELLQRELADGFLVGSHSVTHVNLKHASGDQLAREVDASIRTLAAEAHRPIGMFRPPYGSLGPAGRLWLKKLGLTEVLWSVDTLDWKAHDPERLRKKVISMIKHDDGGVVLMHDVKPITARIIADVLDDLEAENCARLAAHREPILPVSLHYFLRDRDGRGAATPRELPAAIHQRTEAYRAELPERCAKRPPAAEPAAQHATR
jgi:peptidoglycan/xylan/chitin deacetylase (PgdA/CDA1 family)